MNVTDRDLLTVIGEQAVTIRILNDKVRELSQALETQQAEEAKLASENDHVSND